MKRIKFARSENVIFLMIAVAIAVQLPQSLTPERRHRAVQKEVGLWLKQNTPPNAVIMSNSPQETFYAGREFMMLPQEISRTGAPAESYHEIIHYAKAKGVGYILINKNTHATNPGFVKSIPGVDLKEIYKKSEKSIVIYEVIY
jgi:hypothetical protein